MCVVLQNFSFLSYLIVILTNINKLMVNVRRMLKNNLKNKKTIKYFKKIDYSYVTHLDETSHMSAEFVFRYGPKCMGGLILPILVLLHL